MSRLKKIVLSGVIMGLCIGCISDFISVEDEDLRIDEKLIIPDDTLAFYLVEGYYNKDLSKITLDSISKFGNKVLSYSEIVNYDTVNHIFEITYTGKQHIDSLMLARYARNFPIVAISRKELLFGVYINHPAVSFYPNWFELQLFYATDYLNSYLTISHPRFIDDTLEDIRKDERMLEVLEGGTKLISRFPDGTYSGTFHREAVWADNPVADITMTFTSVDWSGSSNFYQYPALCCGTYSILGDTIIFQNECAWTAEFDWSFILSGKYVLNVNDGIVEFYREYHLENADPFVDRFMITRVIN